MPTYPVGVIKNDKEKSYYDQFYNSIGRHQGSNMLSSGATLMTFKMTRPSMFSDNNITSDVSGKICKQLLSAEFQYYFKNLGDKLLPIVKKYQSANFNILDFKLLSKITF
jgi:hypothetical protein